MTQTKYNLKQIIVDSLNPNTNYFTIFLDEYGKYKAGKKIDLSVSNLYLELLNAVKTSDEEIIKTFALFFSLIYKELFISVTSENFEMCDVIKKVITAEKELCFQVFKTELKSIIKEILAVENSIKEYLDI